MKAATGLVHAIWFAAALAGASGCGEGESNSKPEGTGGLAGAAGDTGAGGKGGSAAAGPCVPDCGIQEECCDGRCIDTSSHDHHCGACGARCEAQGATTMCVESTCRIEACDDGFVDCNGRATDGCEAPDDGLPSAPRLVSPMQGEYTGSAHAETSRTPRLRWLAPTTTGSCSTLTFHVQMDDSCERGAFADCAFDSPEVDQTGIADTKWAPDTPLAVSRAAPVGTTYFWRVRACDAPDRCSDWSEVRYLNVGRLRDDLNGDGYSEVLALSMDGESPLRVYIIPGGSSMATRPTVMLASRYDAFADARFVGDVNGDGFMDAVRAQPSFGSGVGAALILGAADLNQVEVVPLPEASGYQAVGAAGDWDGDGFDDFAVASYSTGADAAEGDGVRVYRGGTALDLEQPIEISVPSGTTPGQFGSELEGAFDLNGDGYADLAVMDGDDGRVHIIPGGPAASPSVSGSLLTGGPCQYYEGARLTRAGDMTGDGVSELAARCGNRILVWAGARTPSLEPIWLLDLGSDGVLYGPDIVGGNDLGRDGLADLVFHARNSMTRAVMVLGGSETLSAASTAVTFGGQLADADDALTGEGLTVGDHDGDGRWDVIVQVASAPYPLRWFSGGKTQAAGGSCAQPSSSYEQVGNWCEAATEDIEGKYATAAGTEYAVGSSFGHVLAR